MFDALYAGLPQAVKQTSAQAAVAAAFNVSLVAYEAGPGLVQDGVISGQSATGAVTELLIAAARDDRMQPFYEEALRELRSAGLYSGRERPLPVFTSAGAFRSRRCIMSRACLYWVQFIWGQFIGCVGLNLFGSAQICVYFCAIVLFSVLLCAAVSLFSFYCKSSHYMTSSISCWVCSMYGTWGHIEYTRQPTQLTPKYRAVQVLPLFS